MIRQILETYRASPPKTINGVKVTGFRDFGRQVIKDADGERIPSQDLYFVELANGFSYGVRGSGTEPKIKFYLFANSKVKSARQLPAVKRATAASLTEFRDAIIEDGKGRERYTIPPRIRQAVLKRHGYRCQAPGCRNTRFLEVHHVKMRSAGGIHDPQNLITLCGSCHRMIHSLEMEETVRSRRRSPIIGASANSRPPGVDPPAA